MSKAANIYWDSTNGSRRTAARRSTTTRRRPRTAKIRTRSTPWWLSWVIFGSIFGMLVLSINFRAFSEMREETDQHRRLSTQIQNLQDENLALQEEIHTLKTDPSVIGREAKRLGIATNAEH